VPGRPDPPDVTLQADNDLSVFGIGSLTVVRLLVTIELAPLIAVQPAYMYPYRSGERV
jgi:hypothetical protein